ncbi:ABC transporter substrate-binding protein [Xanthobacter oligotrophicus]|uniref:ABC transporter substrate-binding protein n=1 Tax=Xanthobacter oligotrophicus TaxID=2607286 RepID=UPI0011F3247D|nr:ABC transporter substrate-binding protein [Xanthobacter oligotrophicus]MCG5236797.1 ABC transporter substrate-binding protein [Xanthobacter oligotrophicus]
MASFSRRQFLAAASALALAAAVDPTHLQAAAVADGPVRGGALSIILQPEPVTLTPVANVAQPTQVVAGNVFDGLVTYGFDLKPAPQLAESWEVAPDGLTISFHLRKGVTWHDGKPFTASDVKWSLENVWKTIHPRNKALFENVSAVETPDDHTVVLKFSKPSLPIFSVLNGVGAPILPRHLYEGTDILNNPYNNKPVGTGPFVFKEWRKGEYLVLERNPAYWDAGKPYLDKLVFRVIPDAAARAAAIEKGEVQYAPFNPVPFRDVERLAALPNLKVETRGYEWLSPVLYFDLNVENPYLKDVRVRQAIAHAVDKAALAKVVWFGYGKPAVSPIPSTLTAFHDPSVPTYPFDPKKAEALLDEAGFKRGTDGVRFALTHDFLPYGDDYRRTGEFLKQALKRVGIEVAIRAQDSGAFIKRVYADRDFDISSSYNAAFPDPQIGVVREYWSGWLGTKTPWTNGSGYRNAEVDALIEKAAVEGNPQARAAAFRAFQQIVQRDVPTLPLLELKFFTVHAANLKGAVEQGDQVYSSLRNAWFEAPNPDAPKGN